MIVVSELSYILSQKELTLNVADGDEVIIYYDDSDVIPAKSFAWLSQLSSKVNMQPYSDIGGRDNISFVVGAFAYNDRDNCVVIVGVYDDSERIVKMRDKVCSIYTSSQFKRPDIPTGSSTVCSPVQPEEDSDERTVQPEDQIDRIMALLPDQSVPRGMEPRSFATVLNSAISVSGGQKRDVLNYINNVLNINVSGNLKYLYDTGAYQKIESIVMQK